MNTRIGVLVFFVGFLSAEATQALTPNPQCEAIAPNTKIACTCAVLTGGEVKPYHGHMVWRSAPGNQGEFHKCVTDNGGDK